ncbi:MAG: hypothetical protein EKK37_12935 [Sphingobacteriales bacterium]|nr:MAG: hypothetical protein EKK37_12935 [Sphingobacteriales bacterium]
MKLSAFIELTQEEKRATVLKEGVAIAKRELMNTMVFLFQLPGFYVETYCDKQSKAVVEYRLFHDVNKLTPYLEGIPLDELLRE